MNTYQFNNQTIITAVACDELGDYVILDHSIFYPQGGGQPADKGVMNIEEQIVTVTQVKTIDKQVRHYTNQNCEAFIGKIAHCQINKEIRLLHAKLHSGGHLIGNIVEKLYPNWCAIKGHHFPGQSYVQFDTESNQEDQIDIQKINQALEYAIADNNRIESFEIQSEKLEEYCPNLQYSIPKNDIIRIVGIDQFPYQPCAGTHVKSLCELEGLRIISYKIKKRILKIKYGI